MNYGILRISFAQNIRDIVYMNNFVIKINPKWQLFLFLKLRPMFVVLL